MFKREMKINLKGFLIWTTILVGLFFLILVIYPNVIAGESAEMMDEMLKMFPEDLLKAFNMDISSINTAFGWLKSEGFVMILLIIGCYAGVLGSNILLKEESDKTIEYLNSLPVSRTKIVTSKVFAGLIYIVLMVVLLGIFNFIGLSITEEFDEKLLILLSITPLLPAVVIYFMCMFLSTFTHKTKKTLGISLGIVMLSYVLQVLSTMGEKLEFLKYTSAFTLADIRNVITEVCINPIMIVVTVTLSLILFIVTLFRYDRKELV